MSTRDKLQERFRALFQDPGPRTREAFAAAGGSREAAEPRRHRFSEFIDEDLERATRIADELMARANTQRGEVGLSEALARAEELAASEDTDLLRHALMIFATHHPSGRMARIPALAARAPEQVFGAAAMALGGVTATEPLVRTLESSSTPPEHRLDWWREDPLANEHHQHWHVVYPRLGVPDGQGGRRVKDRHGELFFYMHQQMLARYDAERLAIPQLGRVLPLHDYREPILEGYDPGGLATFDVFSQAFVSYGARPPAARLGDLGSDSAVGRYSLLQHEQLRDRMFDAADSGFLRNGDTFVRLDGHLGSDLLGKTNETTVASASNRYYGNHHGFGHVLIGLAMQPNGEGPEPGAIWNTATAIRDPAFWRWHKHIDDINARYQDRLRPHGFDDAPTDVTVRDVILVNRAEIPGFDAPGFDGQALGQHAFGDTPAVDGTTANANWDQSFEDGQSTFGFAGASLTIATRRELETEMRIGRFELRNGNQVSYRYLQHRPFAYFIRAENRRSTATRVTVRLFLVPSRGNDVGIDDDDLANDRRSWIEMDKFVHELPPAQKTVIYRSDTESAVIRRPIADPGNVVDVEPTVGLPADDFYCECGWPYHLLLPRGTTAGMPFRLLVMLTDHDKDRVTPQGHCGSMSFCGAKDEYPDLRPMGYPFDRPFPRGRPGQSGLSVLTEDRANIAMRTISIRCMNL